MSYAVQLSITFMLSLERSSAKANKKGYLPVPQLKEKGDGL